MRELYTEVGLEAAFKKEFYADLDKLVINKSIVNYAVNISEKILKEEAAGEELQHSRLMKLWYGKNSMTRAVAAYEANR